MKTLEPLQKQVSISDFKTHCTEYLREVESGDVEFVITKHGKVIAITKAPEPPATPGVLLGAAVGTATFSANYNPHTPAFEDDEWEMNQD